jgi:hypothetical protein
MSDIQEALSAYDALMSGGEITPEQEALARRVSIAAAFGATAYERGIDEYQGAHALIRSVLIALIDPSSPELDYLRASSNGGDAA